MSRGTRPGFGYDGSMKRLSTLDEIPREGLKFTYFESRVEMGGILLRLPDGSLRAWKNECRHLPMELDSRAPHSLWDADGKKLVCNSHGAEFLPDSGLCTGGPCRGSHLRSLPLRVEDDTVYLDTAAMSSFLD